MNDNQGNMPLLSDTTMGYSFFLFRVLFFWYQELVQKLHDHVLFFPPPFSPNWHFFGSFNWVFNEYHKKISDHNFKTIKVLCEYHGDPFIVSLESCENFEPTCVFKPLHNLWVIFKKFYTLRFQPNDLSTLLRHHVTGIVLSNLCAVWKWEL